MKLTLLIVLLSMGIIVHAQLAEPLFFNEKIHDFGEVVETAGPVDFEFIFTNNAARSVKIISVQASCGCTTPGWSTDPVAVGTKGFIKVSFDPKGRPGYFNKTLTVTTDLSSSPLVLQIKGTVVERLKVPDQPLSVAKGNLRFATNSFNMGKVFINKPASVKEYVVMNVGTEVVEFKNVVAPAYIKIEKPTALNSNTKGIIKISYDAKLRNQYGFLSDNIEIHTNDSVVPVKVFSVYATAEEFFPTQTPDELSKAPMLVSSHYEILFDRVKSGKPIENSLTLTNRGKSTLEIRSIQSNCTCVIAAMDKQSIKPGEVTQLSWKMNTEGRKGTQNKAITIYSNDPRNPVQRITLSGYIEE
jgi:hypothetical protein